MTATTTTTPAPQAPALLTTPRLKAALEAAGLRWSEEKGGWREVIITAPDGCVFDAGPHELIFAGDYGETFASLWRAVAADWSSGGLRFEPCVDADCEWCNDA